MRWYSREVIGEIQLITSIVFFGLSFVGQRYAMSQNIGPLTYNGWRYLVSSFLLLIVRPFLQHSMNTEFDHKDNEDKSMPLTSLNQESSSHSTIVEDIRLEDKDGLKELWWWGSICGISNFIGSTFQQTALVSVSVAKVGFITGMYVVIVPLVEWFLPHHRHLVTFKSWLAAITSMIGMYFLSGCNQSSNCLAGDVGHGEILVFLSVFAWVVSILASDAGAKRVDCMSLTCIDFIICTVFNVLIAIIFESSQWTIQSILQYSTTIWFLVVFVGITEAAAFTLSTLGQMYTSASRAALLMSLEAVSAAFCGYLFLQETLNSSELVGCMIMFIATLASSVDWDCFEHNNNHSNSSQMEAKPLIVRTLSLPRPRAGSAGIIIHNPLQNRGAFSYTIVEMKQVNI